MISNRWLPLQVCVLQEQGWASRHVAQKLLRSHRSQVVFVEDSKGSSYSPWALGEGFTCWNPNGPMTKALNHWTGHLWTWPNGPNGATGLNGSVPCLAPRPRLEDHWSVVNKASHGHSPTTAVNVYVSELAAGSQDLATVAPAWTRWHQRCSPNVAECWTSPASWSESPSIRSLTIWVGRSGSLCHFHASKYTDTSFIRWSSLIKLIR